MNSLSNEFQIKRLKNGDLYDLKKLIELFNEVYNKQKKEEADVSHLIKLLEKPEFIVFVISRENEIIGGLTAYEIPIYYKSFSEVYIKDLAIKKDYQRKGLGKQLFIIFKKYCKMNNISTLFADVAEDDYYAIDFYRFTCGEGEKVVRFNYDMDNYIIDKNVSTFENF